MKGDLKEKKEAGGSRREREGEGGRGTETEGGAKERVAERGVNKGTVRGQ